MNKELLKRAFNQAYSQAEEAYQNEEVPVGAVLLIDNKIVSESHNSSEVKKSPLRHAELQLLNEGISIYGPQKLKGAIVVVTLEPCLMCLGAMINAGVKSVYFGAYDYNEGAFSHHGISLTLKEIEVHFIEDRRCSQILTDFFKHIRFVSLKERDK